MTTHSEKLKSVQQELWSLIYNADVKQVLETIIEKINEVGEGSEHLKQLHEEVRAYICEYPKYDGKYRVASYILYTNIEKFKDVFVRLDNINSEISVLKDELGEADCLTFHS